MVFNKNKSKDAHKQQFQTERMAALVHAVKVGNVDNNNDEDVYTYIGPQHNHIDGPTVPANGCCSRVYPFDVDQYPSVSAHYPMCLECGGRFTDGDVRHLHQVQAGHVQAIPGCSKLLRENYVCVRRKGRVVLTDAQQAAVKTARGKILAQ